MNIDGNYQEQNTFKVFFLKYKSLIFLAFIGLVIAVAAAFYTFNSDQQVLENESTVSVTTENTESATTTEADFEQLEVWEEELVDSLESEELEDGTVIIKSKNGEPVDPENIFRQ
jgi:hypothetical protein